MNMRFTLDRFSRPSIKNIFYLWQMRFGIKTIFIFMIGIHEKCFVFLRNSVKRFRAYLRFLKGKRDMQIAHLPFIFDALDNFICGL